MESMIVSQERRVKLPNLLPMGEQKRRRVMVRLDQRHCCGWDSEINRVLLSDAL